MSKISSTAANPQRATFKRHIMPPGTPTQTALKLPSQRPQDVSAGISHDKAGTDQATILDAFVLWLRCGKICPFSEWLDAYTRTAAREAWGTDPRSTPLRLPDFPGGVFFRRYPEPESRFRRKPHHSRQNRTEATETNTTSEE